MRGSAKSIHDSTLIGVTVLDSQGQKLGQIKEVLVDSQTGKATFLVLDAVATGSSHPVTYTAARPIDNSSVPSTSSQPMPAPYVVPSPSRVPSTLDGRRIWKIFTMNDGTDTGELTGSTSQKRGLSERTIPRRIRRRQL